MRRAAEDRGERRIGVDHEYGSVVRDVVVLAVCFYLVHAHAERLYERLERFVAAYGAVERSFASKLADVRRQLERGEARIEFDPVSETVNIVQVRYAREVR